MKNIGKKLFPQLRSIIHTSAVVVDKGYPVGSPLFVFTKDNLYLFSF